MVYKRDMADWEKEQTLAKKNKKTSPLTEKSDIPYQQKEKAEVPKFKVTDADKKYKTEAWKRWKQGNPNYYYAPGKGKA